LLTEKQMRHSLIAVKVHRSHNRNGHDFGVTQHTLRIVTMMLPFQQVVTQAINKYNVGVHGVLRSLFWLSYP
jgi:hypothetical protein